jgi:outer membrane beta-barrel protein
MKSGLQSTVVAVVLSGLAASPVLAAAPSLEDQLQSLNLPTNQAPAGISTEKLYSVQSRFNPLAKRLEFSMSAGQDFTNSSFLNSQQLGGGLRYHFNDRWSLGVSAATVFNALTMTAQQLITQDGIVPDLAYAKSRMDASVAFNTVYGKFRVSTDQVFYLDQYIALGAGVVNLDRGSTNMGVLDLGFAFWMGRSGVVRLGIKNHLYREQRELSAAMTQHWVGHIDLGWMTGGVR